MKTKTAAEPIEVGSETVAAAEPIEVGSETVPKMDPVKASGWTEDEQARIAVIQEERQCTRANAIRVMRAEQVRGVTTVLEHGRLVETPTMAANKQASLDKVNAGLTGKAMHQPTELNARLAAMRDKAPHLTAKKAAAPKAKVKSDYDKAQRIKDGICLYRDADGACPKKVQVVNGKKRRCCPEHMEHFRKRNKKYAKDHAK